MIIRWCSIDFFQIKDLGFLSSLLRFYVFFSRVIVAEFQSEDFTMSFKRISILIFLLFVLPGLIIWNHVGFYLDDIFYPDWKGEQVHRPLFIVGNARSGTTWLHRLIALDEATFTTFRTWEIIFGVSVTWKITIIYLYNLDQFFSSPLFRAMSYLEGCILGRMALHQVGLQEVEEDEWLMMHVFLSQLVMLFFPLGGIVLRPLVLFDKADLDTFPLEMRRQIFIYYKQCVKRHLYARSLMQPKVHASAQGESNKDNVIFLSKNPPFTMRLDELYETFPDCRVACLVRDPLQSVPSMISYIAKVRVLRGMVQHVELA